MFSRTACASVIAVRGGVRVLRNDLEQSVNSAECIFAIPNGYSSNEMSSVEIVGNRIRVFTDTPPTGDPFNRGIVVAGVTTARIEGNVVLNSGGEGIFLAGGGGSVANNVVHSTLVDPGHSRGIFLEPPNAGGYAITNNWILGYAKDIEDPAGVATIVRYRPPVIPQGAYLSSTSAVVPDGFSIVQFGPGDTVSDIHAMHAPSINAGRLTVNKAGYDRADAAVHWPDNGTGDRLVQIELNNQEIGRSSGASPDLS